MEGWRGTEKGKKREVVREEREFKGGWLEAARNGRMLEKGR